jgi:uncharacterized protein YdcH (DUF465 family)
MDEAMAKERAQELEVRHRSLSQEVYRLERRAYLTPNEQREMTNLKKQKLATKDELYAIRRNSSRPPSPA